jgi:hypothetical protein
MVSCTSPLLCCVDFDFIIKANREYIDKIKFFGIRKCNCQSYVFYMLRCFGINEKTLYKERVVETDSGFIRTTVVKLAQVMEYDRPTCAGKLIQL